MWLRTGVVAALVALAGSPAAASSFALDTSAFFHNGKMPKIDAAGGACGGRNVSPPLRMSGYPSATRSFAIVVFDPDARRGAGFTHWVAYGIGTANSTLHPGLGMQPSPLYTGGINDAGTAIYYGPCPPAGDPPHRYVFTAYALDLAPGALAPGLTRAAFLRTIASHRLAEAQITGLFSR